MKRRNPAVITILAVVLFMLSGCTKQNSGRPQPKAVKGTLDLSTWDFEKDGPVDLSGEWEFYWKQLLLPAELRAGQGRRTGYIEVPGIWDDYAVDGKKVGARGYATHSLLLFLPEKSPLLAIYLRSAGSSHEIYWQDVRVAENGQVSASPAEIDGEWRPVYADVKEGGVQTLTVRIASDQNPKGGFWYPIRLIPLHFHPGGHALAPFRARVPVGGKPFRRPQASG